MNLDVPLSPRDVAELNGKRAGRTGPDLLAAERAAAAFLTALGVSLDLPHVRETPRRMAHAFAELLTVEPFEPTIFDNDGYGELVVVGEIPFHSLCAHHGLPFFGKADVGYVPVNGILGLSKVAWAVRALASQLQVQERLTAQVADWLVANSSPAGVAVRVRAEHLCMSLRGVRARGAVTTTFATRGVLVDDPLLRDQWVRQVGAGSTSDR